VVHAREGDHDAVDAPAGDQLRDDRQVAEARESEAQLVVVVRWKRSVAPWTVTRAAARVSPEAIATANVAMIVPRAAFGASSPTKRPYSGHDSARQVSTSLGASPTPLAHVRRSSRA
jgi:hypothetical protein